MPDENEFLSPHGIRSLSRSHADTPCFPCRGSGIPCVLSAGGVDTGMFAAFHWRGPIVRSDGDPNVLIIRRSDYEDHLVTMATLSTIECPRSK